MAENAVTYLLDNLTPSLQNEDQLLWGLRAEVEYFFDELERVKAFLRDTDGKEDRDPNLKVWVKQVRDVAYGMENITGEFKLRFTHFRGHHRLTSSLCKSHYFFKNLPAM